MAAAIDPRQESNFEDFPATRIEACYRFCELYREWRGSIGGPAPEFGANAADQQMAWFGLASHLSEAHGIGINPPKLGTEAKKNRVHIEEFLNHVAKYGEQQHTLHAERGVADRYRSQFERKLGDAFHYAFNDKEFEQVQTRVNELRNSVNKLDSIKPRHKTRILKRIDALQAELTPKMSSVDAVLGVSIDAVCLTATAAGENEHVRKAAGELWSLVKRVVYRTALLPPGGDFLALESSPDESASGHEEKTD